MPKISGLLIPAVVDLARELRIQYLTVTPRENMSIILLRYFGFRPTVDEFYGLPPPCDFTADKDCYTLNFKITSLYKVKPIYGAHAARSLPIGKILYRLLN